MKIDWETDKYLTTKKAAEISGLSVGYIRDLIHEKKIKGYRLGGGKRSHFRVKESDLKKFVEGKA